jgi:hypothetical protein
MALMDKEHALYHLQELDGPACASYPVVGSTSLAQNCGRICRVMNLMTWKMSYTMFILQFALHTAKTCCQQHNQDQVAADAAGCTCLAEQAWSAYVEAAYGRSLLTVRRRASVHVWHDGLC